MGKSLLALVRASLVFSGDWWCADRSDRYGMFFLSELGFFRGGPFWTCLHLLFLRSVDPRPVGAIRVAMFRTGRFGFCPNDAVQFLFAVGRGVPT